MQSQTQTTTNMLYKKCLLTTKDISIEEIELIISTSNRIKCNSTPYLIQNKTIASCFFEPSTRTRLSFESAALQLGGKIIGFSSEDALSIQKGETLSDTIQMLSAYADLIIMRHPKEGAAILASEVSSCPIINAGDGANQHPTQALLDLYTIKASQNKLDGLSVALVGDLRYGRTIHSLIDLFAHFDIRLYLVSPEILTLPDSICNDLKKRGTPFSFHHSLDEVISKIDILYMTRIQQERFNKSDYDSVKNQFILSLTHLEKAKPNMKILHPLPRVNEIPTVIDQTPFAHYFQQAKNGVLVRQALLSLILNESLV